VFLKHRTNKVVNLNNVSNICVDMDKSLANNISGKVIFNMNYSVKVFGEKFTPDYVYWEFKSLQELAEIDQLLLKTIANKEYNLFWIAPLESGQKYVNMNCVSSVNIDYNKNRVIFNLNYNISHPKNHSQLTSDFVFMDFSTLQKFEEFNKTLDTIMLNTNTNK